MATYNGARYIQEQLQSFVDQTRLPDELIITDDGSTDHTEAIVRDFAKSAPFAVEFHRNEKNLGYCGNFNGALMKTTGDLVFLSDQDDVWFPEKIQHMLMVAELNPQAMVVMNDAALTDGDLSEVGLTKIGQMRSAGFGMESFVMGCCCAVRREFLDLVLPIPEGYRSHDNWLVAIANGLNARTIEFQVLQYYRRHGSNESQFIVNRTTKLTRLDRLLESLRRVRRTDDPEMAQMYINQSRIFATGLQNIIVDAPSQYRNALVELMEQSHIRADGLEKRASIRSKTLFPRITSASRYLFSGGYAVQNGLKSFARDLLG